MKNKLVAFLICVFIACSSQFALAEDISSGVTQSDKEYFGAGMANLMSGASHL